MWNSHLKRINLNRLPKLMLKCKPIGKIKRFYIKEKMGRDFVNNVTN